MNEAKYKLEAQSRMPKVEVKIISELYRHQITEFLDGRENLGIELGVATGAFSRRLLESGKFRILFGVDVYGDIHDVNEYKNALKKIGIESAHKLLRLTFDDALDIFPDEYFDFIYVDGFAHTGEEGGKTLVDWYKKLKIGGIMAGDDYHDDWPLVMWAVNHFASQLGTQITLTGKIMDEPYSKYPTWFFQKSRVFDPDAAPLDSYLVEIAQKERMRIQRLRMHASKSFIYRILRFIKRIVTNPDFFLQTHIRAKE